MSNILYLAGAVTGLAAAAAVLWSMFRWAKRITEGARCQLRSDMLRTYYHHRETERIRQYEYLYENTYKEALLPGAVVAVGAPEMTIENYDKQSTNLSFTISLPQGSQYLELPLLYYPGYKAEVNGEACRVVRGDNNVLRVYGVPEGAGHDVCVWFESPGIWLAAQGASLCGAALLAIALLGMRRRKERA